VRQARLGCKFLFVQPTKALIAETVKDCTGFNTGNPAIPVRAIHGGNSANVVTDIVAHSKATKPGGEVLLITHSAFMMLPYFDRRHDWQVIFDEIPQADFYEELAIPQTYRLITDFIEVDADAVNLADNRYVRVRATDRQDMIKIARNTAGDQVWKVFQNLASKLMSPHWSSYVLDAQFADLISHNGEKGKLLAFAVLNPSLFDGFKTATIMGACFEQSVLCHLWATMGVKFRRHKAIQKGLRYQRHDNGRLLNIRYAVEEPWSKTLRDKEMIEGQTRTVFDHIIENIIEIVSGDFVWMANTDVPDDIFWGRGHRLPNSAHGLNPYQHLHEAVILSALNPPPAHFTFLAAFGLDSTEVKQAGYWQAVYQAAMRISLRNPDDQNPKTVTVMDQPTAEWLAGMFPGCTVASIGLMGVPVKGQPGRPRHHANSAERKRAYRDQFKHELRTALDLIGGTEQVGGGVNIHGALLRKKMPEFGYGRDTTLSTMGRTDLSAMGGTIFASIFSAKPLDFMPLQDIEAFIDALRYLHADPVPSKDQNGLISPAIFDPDLAEETNRGLANIRAVWGIWLDNDGGDLTPKAFARLFPRLRMAIFNSYSSTQEKPRWRVFIPTTIAMPIAAYKAIVGQIMFTVNEAGFWSLAQLQKNRRIRVRLHHGFDMSKLTPSSLFYLPVQARDPKASFFDDYHDDKRVPLDPYKWVRYAANREQPEPAPIVPPVPSTKSAPFNLFPEITSPAMRLNSQHLHDQQAASVMATREARREKAIQKWRTEGTAPGVGNQKFFELGRDLFNAGMTDTEISAALHAEAAFAHRPNDRRAQIRNIISNLKPRNAA
jgi:hypothetical protein